MKSPMSESWRRSVPTHVLMCGKIYNKTVNVDSMGGLLFMPATMLISTYVSLITAFAVKATLLGQK
jgi:hypothetical protein